MTRQGKAWHGGARRGEAWQGVAGFVTTQDLGRLVIVPMTLREANAYVAAHHRHSKPVRGSKFALGAAVMEAAW